MKSWRWDQGRLDYFQFDEIKKISLALMDFDCKKLPRGDENDSLRMILKSHSQRPFAPANYKVWRNYKRVFGCQLLATEIGGVMYATDLCKEIANEKIDSNDYLINLSKRFYFSSPVFDDYNPTDQQVFPICAIIKFLVSKYIFKKELFVSIDEIIDYIKGNHVKGDESIEEFSRLKPTGYSINSTSDEYRQIREMIQFISQLSFLKWDNPNLFLDVDNTEDALKVANFFEPSKGIRKNDAAQEVLQLGSGSTGIQEFAIKDHIDTDPNDIEFSEGLKARASHLRRERSGKLRDLYFKHTKDPNCCNMCAIDTSKRYPWSTHVLELHHLLPLASPIRVEKNSSSLKDLVGLCPTCHRATHKYYSKWFKENGLKDFRDYTEAKSVYQEAKSLIVI